MQTLFFDVTVTWIPNEDEGTGGYKIYRKDPAIAEVWLPLRIKVGRESIRDDFRMGIEVGDEVTSGEVRFRMTAISDPAMFPYRESVPTEEAAVPWGDVPPVEVPIPIPRGFQVTMIRA